MGIADGEVTSMALCWQLERADGAGIALTGHDQALERDGVQYSPTPGSLPASIKRSTGLDPDGSEIAGALSSDALHENDLALGRWNGATMRLVAFDWRDAEVEPIRLIAGEIGAVSIDGAGFSAELLGAAAGLDAPVCPATSPECRAQLGDKRCRVDLAGRSLRATVVAADGSKLTLDRAIDDRFVLGRLLHLSGDNCGGRAIVLSVEGASLTLRDLPRGRLASGDTVQLFEGCDKRLATCATRFDNAVNFRGEPHLPGNDLLTRYPGA